MNNLRRITLPGNRKKRGRQTDYFTDNSFYDAPLEEYKAVMSENEGMSKMKRVPAISYQGMTVFPCYVYNKHGSLLRVIYPKKKRIESARWK